MELDQESQNKNQENGVLEVSPLETDNNLSNNTALTVCDDKESTTEANGNSTFSSVVSNNGINIPMHTIETVLTDEHSYANVNNECINEHQSSTIVENHGTDELMHSTEPVLTLDTMNNMVGNVKEQIESYNTNGDNETAAIVSNEVVITEEIVMVHDMDIQKCIKNNDSKSTDLNNGNDDTKNTDLFYIDNQTSLAVIAAQYDSSDSENENSKSTVNVSNVKNYRNKDEVVLSSDDSSDSESDSSSSDSDSDSSSSSSDCNDSDDESKNNKKGNNTKKIFKPKSEFDDLPPIEDLKISVPEVLCDPLGEVAWTVEQMVVVRPKPGKPTLNLDTILFIDKGQRALGHIFDVFGQVAEPHYCVRFNSSDHIKDCDIKVGMTVYYCPNTPYTSLVFLSELTKMKAIDDIGDDEPPQFSDDEEEQAYLAGLRNKANNNKQKDTANERPNKRRRGNKTGWQSNHPWNSNREQMQSNGHPLNPRPFYRTQHPWSRPRYQQPNPWNQYNSYPNNQWMGQYPQYNEIPQSYNDFLARTQAPSVEMQNVRFPQMQWNPHYPLPQMNPVPVQRFPQTLVPPFAIPPPPPPNPDT